MSFQSGQDLPPACERTVSERLVTPEHENCNSEFPDIQNVSKLSRSKSARFFKLDWSIRPRVVSNKSDSNENSDTCRLDSMKYH
jgi:hypothetical protein